MRFWFIAISYLFTCHSIYGQSHNLSLPIKDANKFSSQSIDWLVNEIDTKAEVYISTDQKDITLYNGLLKRVFRIFPNVACTDYTNLTNGQQLLRAIKPEARIKVNGKYVDPYSYYS